VLDALDRGDPRFECRSRLAESVILRVRDFPKKRSG
jgi:hypothetical protein